MHDREASHIQLSLRELLYEQRSDRGLGIPIIEARIKRATLARAAVHGRGEGHWWCKIHWAITWHDFAFVGRATFGFHQLFFK